MVSSRCPIYDTSEKVHSVPPSHEKHRFPSLSLWFFDHTHSKLIPQHLLVDLCKYYIAKLDVLLHRFFGILTVPHFCNIAGLMDSGDGVSIWWLTISRIIYILFHIRCCCLFNKSTMILNINHHSQNVFI